MIAIRHSLPQEFEMISKLFQIRFEITIIKQLQTHVPPTIFKLRLFTKLIKTVSRNFFIIQFIKKKKERRKNRNSLLSSKEN